MPNEIGKPTKGGWGNVVDVNDSSHITITNEKADVGKGFHITSETGKDLPNVRDYFDNNGNFDKSE